MTTPDEAPENDPAAETEQAPATPRHRVEWWHRLRPMTRRGIRAALAFVLTGMIAAPVGLLSADYTGSLGPHEAEYSVRLNDEIRIDMGPIGALIIDSPLPLNLGVYVQVREIPVGLTTPETDPIAGLTADLHSYTQFFANPEPVILEAAHGLLTDALCRFVLFWCVLLMLVACARLAAHGVLREALKGAWSRTGVPYLSIAVVVVVTLVPLVDATRSSGNVGRTSTILAGTPLADARITGRLASLVDYYGKFVVDAVDDNTEFYAAVQTNLATAFETDRTADEHGLASPAPTDLPSSNPTETGTEAGTEPSATEDADVEAAGGGADAAEESDPDVITAVMVTDLHCNVGMADVIGATVAETGADLILNGGDTVMAGTSVESYCVSAFDQGFGNDVPVVVADGNHDSSTTAEQERQAGWITLTGEPVEVAGLRILGDTDPTLSSLGVPTRPTRDETVPEMGDRLAAQGCALAEEGQPVDVLLIHSPYAGRQILEAGCAPVSLSGHLHRQVGPRQLGLGTQYVGASTAGAGAGAPTIGPLHNPATITVIRWDAQTHLPMDYRVITVDTDTSVDLAPWTPWPPQPTEFVTPDEAAN